jgi:hypothetical protein
MGILLCQASSPTPVWSTDEAVTDYFRPIADGTTVSPPYALTTKDVPVNRFWSISVYNEAGYLIKTLHRLGYC